MDNEQRCFLIGMVVGIIITILIWILVIEQVEIRKVRNGYLTLKNKTYTVALYDTLDTPENKNNNKGKI